MRIFGQLNLRSEAEDGRRRAITSGYRPLVMVPEPCGAIVELEQGRLEPGEAGAAWLTPFVPEHWPELSAGQTLFVCEGPRVVGQFSVASVRKEETA